MLFEVEELTFAELILASGEVTKLASLGLEGLICEFSSITDTDGDDDKGALTNGDIIFEVLLLVSIVDVLLLFVVIGGADVTVVVLVDSLDTNE